MDGNKKKNIILCAEVKWSHKLEDIDLSGLKDCARDLK
jgi:hypothetical protein